MADVDFVFWFTHELFPNPSVKRLLHNTTSTKQFPYSARQLHATPQPQSIIIHSVGDRALVEGVATVTLSQGKVLTLHNRNHIRNTLSLT